MVDMLDVTPHIGYIVFMDIKIKSLSTWANVVFELYIGNNYAGSFDSFKEAQSHGIKITSSFLLLENN